MHMLLNLEFSGVVTVANDLDYDAFNATRVYALQITATDLCNEGGRNQTGVLTISLVNVDDNPPQCPSITPLPNATEGQNVVTFYRYPAIDIDAPPFNVLKYTILPVPTGNVFSIDMNDGIISVIRGDLIDRETMSIYCETIFVNSTLTCSAQVCTVDKIRVHMNVFLQFCVNIVDANDNCPMFSAPTINISVSEALDAGAVVDTVTAVDDDVGANAEFNYRIAGGTGQGWDNMHTQTQTHACTHTHTHTHTHSQHTHTHKYICT